eukprot:744891_1
MSLRRLVSMYRELRKLKHGDKLVIDQNMHQNNDSVVRVMSYNILADGDCYALGKWYDYCAIGKDGDPLAFSKWSYRGPRILAQIQCYSPDILCLQETTHHTFTTYLEPQLFALGYRGIHGVILVCIQKVKLSVSSGCTAVPHLKPIFFLSFN